MIQDTQDVQASPLETFVRGLKSSLKDSQNERLQAAESLLTDLQDVQTRKLYKGKNRKALNSEQIPLNFDCRSRYEIARRSCRKQLRKEIRLQKGVVELLQEEIANGRLPLRQEEELVESSRQEMDALRSDLMSGFVDMLKEQLQKITIEEIQAVENARDNDLHGFVESYLNPIKESLQNCENGNPMRHYIAAFDRWEDYVDSTYNAYEVHCMTTEWRHDEFIGHQDYYEGKTNVDIDGEEEPLTITDAVDNLRKLLDNFVPDEWTQSWENIDEYLLELEGVCSRSFRSDMFKLFERSEPSDDWLEFCSTISEVVQDNETADTLMKNLLAGM